MCRTRSPSPNPAGEHDSIHHNTKATLPLTPGLGRAQEPNKKFKVGKSSGGKIGKWQGTKMVVITYQYIVFCFYLTPSEFSTKQEGPPLGATRALPSFRRSEWSSEEEPDLKKPQPKANGENECTSNNKKQQKKTTQKSNSNLNQEAKPPILPDGWEHPKHRKIIKIESTGKIETDQKNEKDTIETLGNSDRPITVSSYRKELLKSWENFLMMGRTNNHPQRVRKREENSTGGKNTQHKQAEQEQPTANENRKRKTISTQKDKQRKKRQERERKPKQQQKEIILSSRNMKPTSVRAQVFATEL